MLNEFEIYQLQNNCIILSILTNVSHIRAIHVDIIRKKYLLSPSTHRELKSYHKLSGELVSFGYGSLPQTALAGSIMQQLMYRLVIADLCRANGILRELKDLDPIITFRYLQQGSIPTVTSSSLRS